MIPVLAFFQNTRQEADFWWQMLPIVGFFVIIYFFMLRPQIKQQKQQQSMIDNLKKGDKVITNGGLWGEVDAVERKTVRLKVNDKTKVVISRSAISGLQPTSGEGEGK